MDYNENLCQEKHRRIDERLDIQDNRLNNHGNRLDKIEKINSKMEERLSGLIVQLGNLNTTLKWFIGLLIGSFIGFFFYAVQSGLFK